MTRALTALAITAGLTVLLAGAMTTGLVLCLSNTTNTHHHEGDRHE